MKYYWEYVFLCTFIIMTKRQTFFKVAAILSLLVATYHFIGIFYPINSSPPRRHAVFVFVCLFCCYGILKRPKYFIYVFFVLVVQQFYSHGSNFLQQWFDYNKIDWLSLVLLPFLVFIFYNLVLDSRSKGQPN
jgi:hypothetical protein